jgi:hypothetical protein
LNLAERLVMSDTPHQPDPALEQWAAFQRIWSETFTKMLQLGFTPATDSPPEFLRQMRSGLLEALAQSWEQFLRSPQFLDGLKQWMDQAILFRKWSNDFLAATHQQMQIPSREEVDGIMLAVRQMESRVLGQLEALAAQVQEINQRSAAVSGSRAPPGRRPSSGPAPAASPRARGPRTRSTPGAT